MKIAFFVDSFPKISETFILNQITGLLERGHDVRVFSREAGDEGVVHADFAAWKLAERTEYYGDDIVSAPSNKLRRTVEALQILIASGASSRSGMLKSLNTPPLSKAAISLTTFYTVLPFLNRGLEAFDVIHCHFGPAGVLAALLKQAGVIRGALVTTFHGYDITSHIKQYGQDAYQHLFKVGDLFMPISQRWRNELIRLGCPPSKAVVHHMGVDLERFNYQTRGELSGRTMNVISIARLVEKKGLEYGVRAVARLAKQHPLLRYQIIGDGPMDESLQALIDELNASDAVELVGWKSQAQILEYMAQADLLLAPSVTAENGDQEGIPVVLMEAMAQGIPVLSTQHSGIPELIEDGVSGYLVPERDVDALTERLRWFFEERVQWSRLSAAGRARIEMDFNIDRLNDMLVKHYQELLT